MLKNQKWMGECVGYAFDGTGVVKKDGFVYFVKGLLDGEKAELAVLKTKKNFGYARIVEIVEPSIHRVEAACAASKQCGGCSIMYMDKEEQNKFKEFKVQECFKKNAHMDITPLPIINGGVLNKYRNKVVVPVQVVDGRVKMGFYAPRTNTIVEYDECLVQTDLSNLLIKEIREELQQLGCGKYFRHVLIKHAHLTNEVMIGFIVKAKHVAGLEKLARNIAKKHPEVKSIMQMVNKRNDNVILDGLETCVYGRPYIEEELLGERFRISLRSFYQINPYATAKLYSTALDYANIKKDDVVVDLYCGTGTIGLIASRRAKQVYGIEIVEEAIVDAKKNALANNIENAEFFAMDAGIGAEKLNEMNVVPDVVIVDPPRKGCSKETLDAIFKMNPERLVYVSCDPATLARDVDYLVQNNYELKTVQPCDLFPHTTHVETVALLTRK